MAALPPELLAQIDASFTAISAGLRRDAPAEHARVVKLLRALRAGKRGEEEARALVVDLLRWQLRLQREEAAGTRARFANGTDDASRAAVAALDAVVALFDQAIARARDAARAVAPAPAERRALDEAAARATAAVARAEALLASSTAGVPVKPLATQPVSSTGVRLRPVVPAAPGQKPAKRDKKTTKR